LIGREGQQATLPLIASAGSSLWSVLVRESGDRAAKNTVKVSNRLSEQLHISSASSNWLSTLRAYLVTVAVADLVWELAHLPLYTLWRTGTPSEKLFAVVHCTAGDLLIALVSLTAGLVLAGHRDRPARRFMIVAVLTLTFGFCYTVFSEWLNVVVRRSWAYSELMPVVSIFGLSLGISPLLQWMVVPTLALYASRRLTRRPAR
jgi:hypothetical protein